MRYEFVCLGCGKESGSNTQRAKGQSEPKYCGAICYRKNKLALYRKKSFSEKSPEEKAHQLSEYYDRNVIKNEGCWDWKTKTGITDKYPRMNYSRTEPRMTAHIYSWLINFGEIPDGMFVCHTCDNPRCSRPSHLFLGTPQDNMDDCKKKGRRPKGQNNPAAKLDETQVRKIKLLIKMGVSMKRIGRDFGVNATTIERINKGTTWKHVLLD